MGKATDGYDQRRRVRTLRAGTRRQIHVQNT